MQRIYDVNQIRIRPIPLMVKAQMTAIFIFPFTNLRHPVLYQRDKCANKTTMHICSRQRALY